MYCPNYLWNWALKNSREVFIRIWLWLLPTLNHLSRFSVCVSVSEHMCKHPNDMHAHAYTHRELATLPLLGAYGGYLIYFPNVSGACSQVSPPNPCWDLMKKKNEANETKCRAHSDTKQLLILRVLRETSLQEVVKNTCKEMLIWATNVN